MSLPVAEFAPSLGYRVQKWLKMSLPGKWRSIAFRLQRLLYWTEDKVFAKTHRLDFDGIIASDDLVTDFSTSRSHACFYQAISCKHVRELIDEAMKTNDAYDNFIDLGSGKGKACFYAATRPLFRKIVGVEFSAPLIAAAEKNKAVFGDDRIFFHHADASTFELPAGRNLVFLFNPFDQYILTAFIQKNIDSFKNSHSVIAYANDHQRVCLAKLGFTVTYRNQGSCCSLHQYID